MTRCRSCGAEVLWLNHARTGKRAPIDAEPSADGNVVVCQPEGTYRVLGPALRADAAAEGVPLHTAHHFTCPQGAEWSARAKAKAGTP